MTILAFPLRPNTRVQALGRDMIVTGQRNRVVDLVGLDVRGRPFTMSALIERVKMARAERAYAGLPCDVNEGE